MRIGNVNIPRTIVAGDSITWRDVAMKDNLGNQVSSLTHILTYAIRGTQNLTLTSTSYQNGWETTITAAQSITLTGSTYYWQAYATEGINRITLGAGQLTIEKNFSTQTAPFDGRTQAKKDLDAVVAAIRAIISNNAVQEYTIGNRSVKKMSMTDLIMLRDQLRYEVVVEQKAEMKANGLGDPHNLFVRF